MRFENPEVIAKYATRRQLVHLEPFKWTRDFPTEINRENRQVNRVASQEPKFKFGEEVPRSVRDAERIDRERGFAEEDSWHCAIKKELSQINEYNVFRSPAKGERLDKHTRIPYHIVFDVKFDGRKKARLVAGGNHTDPPREDIYSGVVEQLCVRLGYMVASLNDLQVCAGDVGNAFLYGKTKELVYIIAGSEFGVLQGCPLIIQGGLYGLRSSSARFHEHLSDRIRQMGYRPTKADPDLWMKDLGTHYEYIATYVDDVLSFSKDPLTVMEEFKKDYVMKGVGKPRYYLGGDILDTDPPWPERTRRTHCVISGNLHKPSRREIRENAEYYV